MHGEERGLSLKSSFACGDPSPSSQGPHGERHGGGGSFLELMEPKRKGLETGERAPRLAWLFALGWSRERPKINK